MYQGFGRFLFRKTRWEMGSHAVRRSLERTAVRLDCHLTLRAASAKLKPSFFEQQAFIERLSSTPAYRIRNFIWFVVSALSTGGVDLEAAFIRGQRRRPSSTLGAHKSRVFSTFFRRRLCEASRPSGGWILHITPLELVGESVVGLTAIRRGLKLSACLCSNQICVDITGGTLAVTSSLSPMLKAVVEGAW
jgi:hypothetical protein